MTVDPYILGCSAITVIVTVWMGFRSAKTSKTASDFFVAGRSVSVGWNASAISGEYLSAASFMGVAGMVMSSGYDALWYPVCYACGYLFLLLFIAGPLRRFGAYTIPDFAEGRFDSPVFRKIAVVFVLFIGFFYTMPQMKGAGTTLAYIFPGLPYWAGVVLVGAVITLNVALGGMKGITLVQAFQYWAKMFAISAPIFVLMAVYGHYGKQLSLNSRSTETEFDQINFRPIDARELSDRVLPSGALSATAPQTATNSPVAPPTLLQQAQTLYKEWKLKRAWAGARADDTPIYSADLTNKSVALLIVAYYDLSGRRLFLVGDDEILSRNVTLSLPKVTAVQFAQGIESAVQSAKLKLIAYQDFAAILAPQEMEQRITNYLQKYSLSILQRPPLPAKAPVDATWLNPFGPLTTKAAKALPPVVTYSGEFESSWSFDNKGDGIAETLKWLKAKATPGSGNLPAGEYTAKRLAEVYAMLASYSDLLSLESEVTLWRGKGLADIQILWTSNANFSPKGLSEAVVHTLKTNGVTVLHDGKNEIKAFLTKEAVVKPADTKPYALLYTYSLIIALVCGTAGLPHILVRFYTNPDGVAAKRTTMWVMILIGVFYVFPPVFGVMGRNLLPELYDGVGAKGTDKVVLELPRILNQKYGVLGSVLSGITCAGAFAAFMSTFSGLLVSMTGAVAHDVYGRMLNPKATPWERMRMFKWSAVMVGGVAILLGSRVEKLEINFMVGQAFAIAAASYFPLLFMSVWWRKLTMKGAAIGMLSGGLLALAGISLTSFTTLGWLKWDSFWAAHPLLRILCEQPAIWAVPLAIVLMIVVSKLTRKEVPADIRMKMLVLHAPEKLGLKQEYVQEHQEHQPGH